MAEKKEDEGWKTALEDLRKGFIRRLPAKVGEITEVWKALVEGWSEDRFIVFHRLVHSVAGTCSTYGFPELGQKARALEAVLRQMKDEGAVREAPPQARRDEITRLLDIFLTSAHAIASSR